MSACPVCLSDPLEKGTSLSETCKLNLNNASSSRLFFFSLAKKAAAKLDYLLTKLSHQQSETAWSACHVPLCNLSPQWNSIFDPCLCFVVKFTRPRSVGLSLLCAHKQHCMWQWGFYFDRPFCSFARSVHQAYKNGLQCRLSGSPFHWSLQHCFSFVIVSSSPRILCAGKAFHSSNLSSNLFSVRSTYMHSFIRFLYRSWQLSTYQRVVLEPLFYR